MKKFKIWFLVDSVLKVTDWPADTKDLAIDEFWLWIEEDGEYKFNSVKIDCVEELPKPKEFSWVEWYADKDIYGNEA